jgi:hypothetical protein
MGCILDRGLNFVTKIGVESLQLERKRYSCCACSDDNRAAWEALQTSITDVNVTILNAAGAPAPISKQYYVEMVRSYDNAAVPAQFVVLSPSVGISPENDMWCTGLAGGCTDNPPRLVPYPYPGLRGQVDFGKCVPQCFASPHVART